MKVSIDIKLGLDPVNKMISDAGLDEEGAVQMFYTQTVLNHILKYIPKKTGNLRHLTQAQTNIAKPEIVTEAPGAGMLYGGVVMEDPVIKAAGFYDKKTDSWYSRKGSVKVPTDRPLKYKTPGTGPFWDKALVDKEGGVLVAEVQRFVDRSK